MVMRRWSSLVVMVVGVGVGFATEPSRGQGLQFGTPVADVNQLTQGLAGRVRHLGEDIASELGRDPGAQHLLEDTQEMALAVDEFQATLRGPIDANRTGQGFAGIDSTWQHLRSQLTGPGYSDNPAVNRAMVRVDEFMGQIRQALGINPPPAAYNNYGPAPSGVADIQRLAHALVSRSQALLGTIQVSMANDPNRVALSNDVGQLVQLADNFHDAIDTNQPVAVVARAFAPVDQLTDRIEAFIRSGGVPPDVQQAWEGVASVEVLLHQNLGLNTPLPVVETSILQPPGGGPSPLVGLSNQFVGQLDAYIGTFGSTGRPGVQALSALGDAQRVRAAAVGFQRLVARGAPPNQLAHEFRAVDVLWQRLIRRASRITQGRTGPYVQQVQAIGATYEQIHRVLGSTGFPPARNLYR